jgi:hypothetical protein
MILEWANALQASALAEALRSSRWAYPLVNTAHVLGIALLVGGAVPLNLRLLGLWRSAPLGPLRRVLLRTTDAGLIVAVAFGILLFLARASAYARSGLFITKMLLLAAAILSSTFSRLLSGRQPAAGAGAVDAALPDYLRLTAGVSLALWTAVLVLGRLVGYS